MKPPGERLDKSLDKTFGDQLVDPEERKRRIRQVFEGVAPRYDLMNDLMSFGIHRWWKKTLQRRCAPWTGRVVDLAGGTGDIARLLAVTPQREIVVCDPSQPMMRQGQIRMNRQPVPGSVMAWVAGEAENLPFQTGSVDLLTVSFGLRNVTHLRLALQEIHRVLSPGGVMVCLEFSRPAAWLAPFYDAYSRWVIPSLGAAVAQQPLAYQYLIESIRRFPDQRQFAAALSEAGFAEVTWENLSFGIACLHFARKSAVIKENAGSGDSGNDDLVPSGE